MWWCYSGRVMYASNFARAAAAASRALATRNPAKLVYSDSEEKEKSENRCVCVCDIN